ncbi:MAG: hypothetical protein EOP06_19620 [Proteobacteria bacterium]|nr:MAG: hypothetical protein EOP06_19620 [Pseudomonadota bacterium]
MAKAAPKKAVAPTGTQMISPDESSSASSEPKPSILAGRKALVNMTLHNGVRITAGEVPELQSHDEEHILATFADKIDTLFEGGEAVEAQQEQAPVDPPTPEEPKAPAAEGSEQA